MVNIAIVSRAIVSVAIQSSCSWCRLGVGLHLLWLYLLWGHLGVGLHRAAQGRLCVGGHGVRLVEDEQLVPRVVRVRVGVRMRVRVRVRVRVGVRVGVRLWVGVEGEW